MLFDQKFHLEKYSGRIMSSGMRIIVDKKDYSWRNVVFREIYQFGQNERRLCKNITGFGFANGLSLEYPESQRICPNIY